MKNTRPGPSNRSPSPWSLRQAHRSPALCPARQGSFHRRRPASSWGVWIAHAIEPVKPIFVRLIAGLMALACVSLLLAIRLLMW